VRSSSTQGTKSHTNLCAKFDWRSNTWDDEADVWIAISEDIPLALESDSLDTLMNRVRLAAPEIIELNHGYK